MSLRVPLLRPLGVADVIDEAFSLFRRNFVLFFCISAILVAPVQIIISIVPCPIRLQMWHCSMGFYCFC
mgnify:CR=1 FL=1